jgi:hypothetical protein
MEPTSTGQRRPADDDGGDDVEFETLSLRVAFPDPRRETSRMPEIGGHGASDGEERDADPSRR